MLAADYRLALAVGCARGFPMRLRLLATLSVLAAAAFPSAALAQRAVFVVRHAEKVSDSDERLSEAGRRRAARLAEMLASAGVNAVFATATERAMDTARPLADRLKIRIETYDVGGGRGSEMDARPFTETLRREHGDGVLLVVGHSNTVPELLKAFGSADAIALGPSDYDNLFLVVPRGDRPATLLRLKY